MAIVLGIVSAAPVAIRIVAAPATRLPFAARLALRDLARYQARAAAALAAITLTLGLSITVVGIVQANQYRSDEGNLSSPGAPDPERRSPDCARSGSDRAAAR